MSYRIGWGENARHFVVAVDTAREAMDAADSMQRYCQEGVVIVNDRIGVVDRSSLPHLIRAEEQARVCDAAAALESAAKLGVPGGGASI